ncbi:hypothetical protein [Rhizobium skierniewicense]|uniref:hypothetical protein n=1 Tax=Rhizobium skierniewicense TaxID=984260 RepID=UPI001573E012|nr:hypothetical protein [Rhizobium skierniewicense]NTF34274.1 hypothetical protein [Rhizobium skierniewicense]
MTLIQHRHEAVKTAIIDLIRLEQLDVYEIAVRLVPLGYAQVETAVALTDLEQTSAIVIPPDNSVVLIG